MNEFSIKIFAADKSEAVTVQCTNQSGRFIISSTSFVLMKGLHFIGCGSNTVTHVNRFVLEDTSFQSVQGNRSVLVLNVTIAASIVRSKFFSNANRGGQVIAAFSSSLSIIGSIFYNNSAAVTVVEVTDTFLTVNNSTFTSNGYVLSSAHSSFTKIGNILSSAHSPFSITNSTFTHNTAYFGTVIDSLMSSFTITESTFVGNNATISGVLATNRSAFNITDSTFVNNSAVYYGSVIYAQARTSFSITKSLFANNIVSNAGGVILTSFSSFIIASCMFF